MFPFGLRYSDVLFFDADGDQDMDLVVAGLAFTSPGTEYKTSLFLNDGNGQFTEDMNASFAGVANGSVCAADIENDGDLDLFIAGGASGQGKTANLYINDGSGSFSSSSQVFTPVDKAAAAFADVDLDGDADLIHTGETSGGRIAELYINDGSGNFSIVANMPFTGVGNGAVLFDDFNNDGKPDLIITGEAAGGVFSSKLYMNQTPLFTANNRIENLALFPNPASTQIQISGLPPGGTRYQLFDVQGRLVSEDAVQDHEISLEGKKPGIYFLKFYADEQFLVSRRFIIVD
jgi:hypothetical protein